MRWWSIVVVNGDGLDADNCTIVVEQWQDDGHQWDDGLMTVDNTKLMVK